MHLRQSLQTMIAHVSAGVLHDRHPANSTQRLDAPRQPGPRKHGRSKPVRLEGQTGVELEALTAVSVAALTLYDMCKAVDRGMVIGEIRLLSKHGGRSGKFQWEDAQ